jgi:hypothetical protein
MVFQLRWSAKSFLKIYLGLENQSSGAKALVDFAALTARLKSCPDTIQEFINKFLILGKEPRNCEEISAAARTQVPFNQVGVEVEHAGLETGRQDAAGLDQIPGLGLNMSQTCKSTPVD